MKKQRQERILEILATRKVETQEEIAALLKSEGYNVTQATVSRDIKELRLVKISGNDGAYYYGNSDLAAGGTRNYNILSDSIISVDNAVNIVVVKCQSGRAGAVCAAIDGMERSKIVGTIAGDDTIFILLKSEDEAAALRDEIKALAAE